MHSTDHIDTDLISPAVRRRAALFAAVAGLAVLTACGPGSGDGGTGATGTHDDGVASLVTASPAGSAADSRDTGTAAPPKQAAVDEKRPQLRLDSTPEEIAELRRAYHVCLTDHGMPAKPGPLTPAVEKAQDAAMKACENKEPLLPPEMDPKRNPHYADAVRVQVKCMKDRGLKVHITPATGSDPNAISWTYDAMPGENVDMQKIQDDCRVKGFGGGRALGPGPA